MAVSVRVPGSLRPLTDGAGLVTADGETVGEVLQSLEVAHPGFSDQIFDDAGGLHPFVNVFLGDEDIRYLDGLASAVGEGQTISIVPAVAGG